MKSHDVRFMIVQILFCVLAAVGTIYAYIEKHNQLTELRLAIPAIVREVQKLQEENIRLQYEIEQFESPMHLMELARKPGFGHLKNPYLPEIIEIKAEE